MIAVDHTPGAEELGQELTIDNGGRFKLFPRVRSLRDWWARGDHVQQVLPLTSVDGGWRLVACQAGVHIGHSDSCEQATEMRVKLWYVLRTASSLLFALSKKQKQKYDSALHLNTECPTPSQHMDTQKGENDYSIVQSWNQGGKIWNTNRRAKNCFTPSANLCAVYLQGNQIKSKLMLYIIMRVCTPGWNSCGAK